MAAPPTWFFTAVNGVLWAASGSQPTIYSYDTGISGASETYTLKVKTAPIKTGQVGLAQGRIRSASLLGKTLYAHTLRVRVLGDDQSLVLMNKSYSMVTETPTAYPGSITPELRTTQQRCSFARVEVSCTPAYGAELSEIEVWVSADTNRATARRRG